MQREASGLHPGWRFRHTLNQQKVRIWPWRGSENKKYSDRSQYMYENKQNKDNMTGEMTDIYANSTLILQKIRDLEGQFAVNCAFRTLLEFQNQQRAVSVEYRA